MFAQVWKLDNRFLDVCLVVQLLVHRVFVICCSFDCVFELLTGFYDLLQFLKVVGLSFDNRFLETAVLLLEVVVLLLETVVGRLYSFAGLEPCSLRPVA